MRGRWLASLILLLVAVGAAPADTPRSPEQHVLQVLETIDSTLRSDSAGARARVEEVFRRAFDLPRIARRVVRDRVWLAASTGERARLAGRLGCRLAAETVARSLVAPPGRWELVGAQPETGRWVVAVRRHAEDGEGETLLFDVVDRRGETRIQEIRSAHGRLSTRLAELVLREAGLSSPPGDVEGWLVALACEPAR